MTHQDSLNAKLTDKTATIAIVGLGYVGLPLAIRFAEEGFKVLGFDIDPTKTEQLNTGQSYIGHIENAAIAKMVDAGFSATSDFARTAEADVILICVPTPLSKHSEPDLSYVVSTAESIAPYLSKGALVTLESTTYPGTTDGELKEALEKGSGLKAGLEFHLAYSPEREDPAGGRRS